jgi:hypothetical protein
MRTDTYRPITCSFRAEKSWRKKTNFTRNEVICVLESLTDSKIDVGTSHTQVHGAYH